VPRRIQPESVKQIGEDLPLEPLVRRERHSPNGIAGQASYRSTRAGDSPCPTACAVLACRATTGRRSIPTQAQSVGAPSMLAAVDFHRPSYQLRSAIAL
jgi:hypothetical protein